MLVSEGQVYASVQWTNITKVSVMSVAIVSKSISSDARNPDWVPCRVWHLIIIQSIIPLSETIKQLKKIISCCLLCLCIIDKARKLKTALSKGVSVACGGLQLSHLLLHTQQIHSRLKAGRPGDMDQKSHLCLFRLTGNIRYTSQYFLWKGVNVWDVSIGLGVTHKVKYHNIFIWPNTSVLIGVQLIMVLPVLIHDQCGYSDKMCKGEYKNS